MQKHRIISLASILAMLLIPVVGWFLVAQPQVAAASAAAEQRTDLEAQIAASAATVAQLEADSAKLPELNDDLNDLRTSIPADADADGYIDGLDALATIAGVQIVGLTVDDAQVYAPAVGPDAPVVEPTDTEGEDATGETDPAATQEPYPGIVTSPLIDSTNFVAIPVSVSVAGDYAQIMQFVDGLQSSPRLFLVTSFSTTEDASAAGGLTAAIGGYIWAIPTGVEGKPRPISTTVKSMTAPEPVVVEETEGTDGESGEPTPDPTSTPAP